MEKNLKSLKPPLLQSGFKENILTMTYSLSGTAEPTAVLGSTSYIAGSE